MSYYDNRVKFPSDHRVNFNGVQKPNVAVIEEKLDQILESTYRKKYIVLIDMLLLWFIILIISGLWSPLVLIAILGGRFLIFKMIMKNRCYYWQLLKFKYNEFIIYKRIEDNRVEVRDRIAWDQVRKQILKRDNYQCQNQNCQKKGVPLSVHHICWVDYGGTNDPKNLISLCEDCHAKMHPWMVKKRKYRRRPRYSN